MTCSTVEESGTQFFIEALPLLRVETQISLEGNSLHFYQVHVTLLNVPDKDRNSLNDGGTSVVAYVPVKFCRQESDIDN